MPSRLYLEKEQVAKQSPYGTEGWLGGLDRRREKKGIRKSMNPIHFIPFHQMVKKMEFKVFHPTRFYFILLRKTRFTTTTTTTTFVCLFTTLCALRCFTCHHVSIANICFCAQIQARESHLGSFFCIKLRSPPPQPRPSVEITKQHISISSRDPLQRKMAGIHSSNRWKTQQL
jgi:hypothetical protein